MLEVRPPYSARRYRYALDWRAQPADARPRLLGLAVAEAVDASRIELTAVPESPAAAGPGALPAASRTDATAVWSVAVIGAQRSFTAAAGVELAGGGVVSSRWLSPHLRVAIDLLAEGDTVVVVSGAIRVVSISAAPRVVYRLGTRAHADLGVAARAGVVQMRGEAPPGSALVGDQQVRAWFGPAATLAVGLDLTPRVALDVDLELGVVAFGATARDAGQPAAVLGGRWTSLGLAATLAL